MESHQHFTRVGLRMPCRVHLKALFLEEQIPSYLITKTKHTHTQVKANEKRFAGDLHMSHVSFHCCTYTRASTEDRQISAFRSLEQVSQSIYPIYFPKKETLCCPVR